MESHGLPPPARLPAIAQLLFEFSDAADESSALACAVGSALMKLLGWPEQREAPCAFFSRARAMLLALGTAELMSLAAKLRKATAHDPVQQVIGLLFANWLTCLGLSLHHSPDASYAACLGTQCERALASLVDIVRLEQRAAANREAPQAAAA